MSEPARLSLRDVVMLALLALALFLPGFASLPPVDRDESRYVVASQRMAETGDFIDIRFQDKPRYMQPAGIYWLQSLSTLATDGPAHNDIWSYRLPSLLSALFAVLMAGVIGARAFGRFAGLAAGVLLATCLSLNFEARIAKTDAALLAAIVAAQFALLRLYLEAAPPRRWAVMFWAALGVGLMIKGPIVLIVAGATVATLTLWDRNIAWLARLRPKWGPLIMLAIAAPWYIAIGVHTDGAFYARALGHNMLGKVGVSQEGHKGPTGYHLALFVLMFWPGSLLLARAVQTAWRRRGEPAVRFLIAWALPTWAVFEIVATKLPHYVLPTYPAIACLCALALSDTHRPTWIGRFAIILWALIWLGGTLALAALGPLAFREFEHKLPPLVLALAVLAVLAALAALWFWRRNQAPRALIALAAASVLMMSNVFGAAAPNLDSFWLSPRIAALARETRPCVNTQLVTVPFAEPSLVFLYGREQTRLVATGAEAADALVADQACAIALVGVAQSDEFQQRLLANGLAPRKLGEVSGRNYSDGDQLALTLWAAQ